MARQTREQRNAKRRQARLDKQYEELIASYKNLFHDLQLGAKYGADLPSMEKVLQQAGTKSGLVKPTKASIKALKKLQSRSGILRQLYWSLPDKSPIKQKVKEEFEMEYEEEHKKPKGPEDFEDWDDYYKEQVDNGKPFEEIEPPKTTALEELVRQIKSILDPIRSAGTQNKHDEMILYNGERVLEMLREILTSTRAKTLEIGEKGAQAWFEKYGGVERENLYSESDVQEFQYHLFTKFADHFKQMQTEYEKVTPEEFNNTDFKEIIDKYSDNLDDGSLFIDDDFI